jgi:hypothetical protein
MTVEQAVKTILGKRLAQSIITDRGLHWAVVAAMAAATTDDDSEAIATIRAHIRRERER